MGSYTGHEATGVDIELGAAGGQPRASVPQFVGVGNGHLAVQSVDAGAPLQAITLTLTDLGVETATAGLDVREVRIRARQPGSSGNALHITVQPALTRTATAWALLAPWSTSAATQTGPQWDFGARPLSPKEEVDASSARIAFGTDPQVYRPWRRFKDGDWQFGLSPALLRDVPAKTPVWSVTGGYVVTVSDGVASEVFGDTQAGAAPIITFYDLLTALATSALVEVAGVVTADRSSGGQAAIDVPLRTSAWLWAITGDVTLEEVAVPDGAPTQTLTVRCINNDTVGKERWSVVGDVSGPLPVATTGAAYAVPDVIGFTVPAKAVLGGGGGDASYTFSPVDRGETEGYPCVALRPIKLGVAAVPQTVTFKYMPRPPAECRCDSVPSPRVSDKCLGLVPEGGAQVLDPEHASRLQALYEWRRDFAASNTLLAWDPRYARFDLDFADAIAGVFSAALQETYDVSAARSEWDGAFTGMQTDMLLYLGVGSGNPYAPGKSITPNQNVQNMLWLNAAQNKFYICDRAVFDPPLPNIEPMRLGWVSPDSPVWDDSGLQFAVTHAGINPQTGDPVSGDALYRCIGTLDTWNPNGSNIEKDEAVEQLLRRYSARMDYVRTLAGIVPKSDPSSGDAGGCWVDHGGDWWWIDTSGRYLPAFTNEGYVSCKRNKDTGKPESTREFGFGLVVACPERLKKGDEITLRILTVDAQRPYKVGDEALVQTIGAAAAWLTGGIDGTDVQTWRVLGSSSGALPDYIVPTDGTAAPLYAQAGLGLHMALGGIPFALGDAFSLAVEAGAFRWRSNGGAWSAFMDIPPDGQVCLSDGLYAAFDAGAAPSFVPGDAYAFAVHQPWAASHVQDAQARAWGWEGSEASMTLELGAAQSIEAIALARYSLPAGATVAVEVSQDGLLWSAPLALDVTRAVAVAFFDLAMAARWLRLSVTDAPGGSIGWLWCGQPLATEHHASGCERLRRWASTRGNGLNAAALYAGAGTGWKLAWDNALLEPDVAALLRMGDWAQAHDEPLIFVPHPLHGADASLVRWGADALQVSDLHAYQGDSDAWRLMSATLDLEPVFA